MMDRAGKRFGVFQGGKQYSLIWATQVCTTPKGMWCFNRFAYKQGVDFDHFGG